MDIDAYLQKEVDERLAKLIKDNIEGEPPRQLECLLRIAMLIGISIQNELEMRLTIEHVETTLSKQDYWRDE